MFRLLWNLDEICIHVPPHPELGSIGAGRMKVLLGVILVMPRGRLRQYSPSVACADYALRNLPQRDGPLPMIASLPAKVLFKFLNDGHTTARILGAGGGQISLPPATVAALVSGAFPVDRMNAPTPSSLLTKTKLSQEVSLHPVPEELIPAAMRQAIGALCETSHTPLGIYVFHQADSVSGLATSNDLHFILAAQRGSAFFQSFCQVVPKHLPPQLTFSCKILTTGNRKLMKFLQGRPVLWPVGIAS